LGDIKVRGRGELLLETVDSSLEVNPKMGRVWTRRFADSLPKQRDATASVWVSIKAQSVEFTVRCPRDSSRDRSLVTLDVVHNPERLGFQFATATSSPAMRGVEDCSRIAQVRANIHLFQARVLVSKLKLIRRAFNAAVPR
jgi:hypothetical protein